MVTAAMDNEMLHLETFRDLPGKRGASPSPLRLFWWLVGWTLGRSTALFGRSSLFHSPKLFPLARPKRLR